MSAEYVAWYGHGRHQDWGTPLELFDRLHAEYAFDLDGAAEPGNALLPDASTATNPIPWTGRRVFCNPPWSDIGPFVEIAAQADLAVLLVPSRTNARWFHRALELGAEARFFAGRPAFRNIKSTGNGHNSPVDCLLLVFTRVPRHVFVGEECGNCGTARTDANYEHPERFPCLAAMNDKTRATLPDTYDAARLSEPVKGER